MASSFLVKWAKVEERTPNLLKVQRFGRVAVAGYVFPVCPNNAPFDYWKSGKLTLFKNTANIRRSFARIILSSELTTC